MGDDFFRSKAGQRRLWIVTGPTAVGKTELVLALGQRLRAVILSCDAFCLYRGMNIGTAKPTRAEQALLPHYGLDLFDVHQKASVADYHSYCEGVLQRLHTAGCNVIVTGGSGFYLQGFLQAIVDKNPHPPELRRRVTDIEAALGLPGLQAALLQVDPHAPAVLDWNNPRRVASALERCWATGQTVAEARAAYEALPEPYPEWEKRLVVLDRPDAELRERMHLRTAALLEAGFVAEVRRLRAQGLETNPSAARAIGYRQVLAHLDGQLPESALAEAIERATWQLARKQRSWFRQQLPEHRVLHPEAALGNHALEAFF